MRVLFRLSEASIVGEYRRMESVSKPYNAKQEEDSEWIKKRRKSISNLPL